ncbi:MAG TPA: hypothetical protein VGF22_18225 [Acidimicrobiales bacterium]|jgi:hypothetical protein
MALESRRWFNPSQPQTLQIAVWLLYFNAVGGLIFGSVYITLGVFLGLIALVGCGAAAFGIANEQRWGYLLGVAMALLQVLLIVAVVGILGLFKGVALISFLFAVALVALLLHPMSRDYQRIWFK